MTATGDGVDALEALRADPSRAEALMIERLLAKAAADSRLTHDVLALSALPRTFDRRVLAVLAERADDDPALQAAFAALVRLPFVHEQRDRTWSLHDTVREPLLRRWQQGAVGDLDYEQALDRLYRHCVADYEQGRRAAEALARVGEFIRAVSPSRFRAAVDRVEDVVVRHALEAQDVAMRISPDRGRDRFERSFYDLEADGALNLAELLVQRYQEDADGAPDDQRPQLRAWAVYFEARLANSRKEWRVGEELLAGLGDLEALDPRLASWVESERARSLGGQARFEEQLVALDREIDLHERLGVDRWNHHWPWTTKADVHASLWDADSQIDALETALGRAESAGNTGAVVSILLRLASALTAGGELDRAAGHIVRALRCARLEGDRAANRDLASCILGILGGRSPRLLNMAAVQYRHLVHVEGASGLLDVVLQRASVLADGGANREAVRAFDEARAIALERVPERLAEVDADRASASEALGEDARAAQRNLDLLADPRMALGPWDQARCATNAALSLLAIGKFDEALQRALEARRRWQAMRHDRAVAFTYAIESEARRKQGDFAGAAAALDHTAGVPARGHNAALRESAAQLALDQGDPTRAADLALEALARTAATSARDGALRAELAVRCLTAAADYTRAAQLAEALRQRIEHLADFATWQPTPAIIQADEHAGHAVRTLVAGHGSMPDRIRSAREHLQAAVDHDPALGWFRLELALLDVRDGRLRAAVRRLDEALEQITDQPLQRAVRAFRDELAADANGGA